jgi:acylphosphatase
MTSPAQTPSTETWLVRIRGIVQGVGFRSRACGTPRRSASPAGCATGATAGVEAMLQGSVDQLTRMREWLHRGPPAAQVDEVDVAVQAPPSTRFDRFEFRRSE